MRRRAFVALVMSGALLGGALPAYSQTDPLPRVGVLVPGAPPRDVFDALRAGLAELGYVDGRTVRLEVRWNTDDSPAQWATLASELVDLGVGVLVGGTNATAGAVKQLTADVPYVSPTLNDPVRARLIESFARPGGKVTGVALITPELIEKRVQLAVQAIRGVRRIGVLWRVDELGRFQLEAAEAAARALGLEVHQMHVSTPEDLGPAFEGLREQHVDAVVMMQAAMFRLHTDRIVALARATKVPVISGETGFAAAGGLMNYGASIPGNWRRMAVYVDKILKGAKPEDLPVEQPAKYELVVNVQSARAIGIELPPAVLVRADEVIE